MHYIAIHFLVFFVVGGGGLYNYFVNLFKAGECIFLALAVEIVQQNVH